MTMYCLDTSAFVEGWFRSYPMDTFPSIWVRLEAMCCDGTIISPDEVLREIARQDDELHAWVKKQNGLFYPLDAELWTESRLIIKAFPLLVKEGKSKNQADPFVVALAKMKGLTVVTEEKRRGIPNKPYIPDVCKHFGVPCINLLDMFREMKWNF